MGKMNKVAEVSAIEELPVKEEMLGIEELPVKEEAPVQAEKKKPRVVFLSKFAEHKIIVKPATKSGSGVAVEFRDGMFATSDPYIVGFLRNLAGKNPDIRERVPETRNEILDRLFRESKKLELSVASLEKERPTEDNLKEIAAKKADLSKITSQMRVLLK